MRDAVEKIWEDGGAGAWLLSPLAGVYALGWLGYLGVYRLGIKKAQRVHSPVVCVGNLVAGGSGKTPLTLAIADLLLAAGREVVVSTSGYGSPGEHGARMAPAEQIDVEEWGDESTMMRWLRPDLRLVVGRNRVEAGRVVAREAPGAVMLMDDGFQHLPLAKDVTMVVDAKGGNPFCFPAGPYREPRGVGALRADRVMRPGLDFEAGITGFLDGETGEVASAWGEVDVLCGIGRPGRFLEALRGEGLEIVRSKILTDHDGMRDTGLLDGLGEERPFVVTAKDYVKLRARQNLQGKSVLVARHEARLRDEDRFMDWLLKAIDESTA